MKRTSDHPASPSSVNLTQEHTFDVNVSCDLTLLSLSPAAVTCEDHSQCVMTPPLNSREWQLLIGGKSILRAQFVGEVRYPGMSTDLIWLSDKFSDKFLCFDKMSPHSTLLCRIVSMVMTLREWAHKSLHEDTERPDSFLERFRGPAHNDIQAPPRRSNQSCVGSEADNELRRSTRRYRCWKTQDIWLKHGLQIFLSLWFSVFLSFVRRKWCQIVILSPSDDAYYHWLIVIGTAVFYNWTFLVVRLVSSCSCNNFIANSNPMTTAAIVPPHQWRTSWWVLVSHIDVGLKTHTHTLKNII